MSMVRKNRSVLRILAIVLILFGAVFMISGSQITQVWAPQQSFVKLAFDCPSGGSNDLSVCTTPAGSQTGSAPLEKYPLNAWQLRWGTVKYANGIDPSGGFLWTQFWYETYRFDTGNTPVSWYDDYGTGIIQPACGTEDFNADHSACNLASLGTGRQAFFGYTATRTMQFPIDTTAQVSLALDDGASLTISGTPYPQTPIYTWIGKSGFSNPATATISFKANTPYLVKLQWFQYTGNALIGNSWTFQNVQSCNFSAGNAVNILLIDSTHGTQNANSLTGTFSVDPTFKIHVDVLQSGCTFTDVPIVLVPWQDSFATNPPRTPITDHLTQISPTAYEKQFTLNNGKYFMNMGFNFNSGTAWGLSTMTMNFVTSAEVQISAANIGTPFWYDPFRIFGMGLFGIGVVFGVASSQRRRVT